MILPASINHARNLGASKFLIQVLSIPWQMSLQFVISFLLPTDSVFTLTFINLTSPCYNRLLTDLNILFFLGLDYRPHTVRYLRPTSDQGTPLLKTIVYQFRKKSKLLSWIFRVLYNLSPTTFLAYFLQDSEVQQPVRGWILSSPQPSQNSYIEIITPRMWLYLEMESLQR